MTINYCVYQEEIPLLEHIYTDCAWDNEQTYDNGFLFYLLLTQNSWEDHVFTENTAVSRRAQ